MCVPTILPPELWANTRACQEERLLLQTTKAASIIAADEEPPMIKLNRFSMAELYPRGVDSGLKGAPMMLSRVIRSMCQEKDLCMCHRHRP